VARRRASGSSDKLLARQKAASERLRREVLGIDGSLRHPYFRDLRRQLRNFEGVTTVEEVLEAATRSDVIYVGDFHAVPVCQNLAADLLEHIARAAPPVALGIEFVFTRQQALLDRRQAGQIDDPTFLRRIHYREEWGYPWEGFGGLLDRARDLGVSVHALDAPPRGGFEGLARRDDHAARRIVSILSAEPRTRLVVLYGESHVSTNHLPKKVRVQLDRAGLTRRPMTMLQDPDVIYWQLLSRDDTVPEAVRISEDAYAVFHGNPLAKYEAYRQVLERWRGDIPPDEEVDLTPAVHHLIGVLLGWLGIRASRYRLRHKVGWSEDLGDAFPEVYSGPEATDLLEPILEEQGRTREEIDEARTVLAHRGSLYESRSNTIFLLRYLPGRAAGEGARFLRAALSGRLFSPLEDTWSDPVARAYGHAYNEALAYLGSRLVDPASDFLSIEERQALTSAAGARPVATHGVTEKRIRWMEMHREFEASRKSRAPAELLDPLKGSRKLRRVLARDLGHRLGLRLFEEVRGGRLETRGLRHLFKRALTEARAKRAVIQLLRSS
jgi:hypothetical protein